MKIHVQVLSRETIKPSMPTSHHLRNFKISLLDQFAPPSYVPVLLFYSAKLSDHPNASLIPDRLKQSLSETLRFYYPLAGRLKQVNSIDCNDEGVDYIEAHVNCSMSSFLENPDISFLNKFLPCDGNSLQEDTTIQTLVAIQTTRFKCGGLVIGVCVLHKVADAVTVSGFINTWAKINSDLHDQVVYPEFSSVSSLFPPRDTMPGDFLREFDDFYFRGSKFNKMKRFVFDCKAIKSLQVRASSKMVPNPSRIEALTAFICQQVMAAYRKENPSKVLMVTHAVNLRQRIEPPLPNNAFGNIIWLAYGFNDLTESKIDLPAVAETAREMFDSLSSETINGLDSNEVFAGLSEVLVSLNSNEHLKILRFTSWCNLGLYEVDFGCGRPEWVAYMGDMVGVRSKQQFLFIEGKHENQIELWMACEEQDLITLEDDSEFLEYAVPNPRVPLKIDISPVNI